jgi:RNA polymerase sigma-B factor
MVQLQTPTGRRGDERLFARYHREGDPAARDELVERFLPLAHKLARRYERANEPLEDLMQVASLALLKAIDRYDPERGDAFTSFAVPTILGELKRHFRDTGWALHVARGTQERVLAVNNAIEVLSRSLGHSPSPQQVAIKLRMPVEQVLDALEAGAAYNTTSLDKPRSDDEDLGTIADTIGGVDEHFALVEDRASIARGLRALPDRERRILYLRFAESMTQAEIAQRMDLSQMHVSRLIRRAIDRVRAVSVRA